MADIVTALVVDVMRIYDISSHVTSVMWCFSVQDAVDARCLTSNGCRTAAFTCKTAALPAVSYTQTDLSQNDKFWMCDLVTLTQ